MKWIGEYRVGANDVDQNSIVTTSNIIRYMQDAANTTMEEDGPSYVQLYESGYSFVLSRMRFVSYVPLYSHDILTVETWAAEVKGLHFDRCYRVLRGGETVAEAIGVWAVVGLHDRRLHGASELGLHYRMDEMFEINAPARVRIPRDLEMRFTGERRVEYADIDINGHMNNTKYPDILCGYLGESMTGRRVASISISFVSEAPFGENIKFYTGYSDGMYYIRTVKEDGSVNVEAIVTTETL